MRSWSDVPIETALDATLVKSARQFRQALRSLQHYGGDADLKGNGEVEEIREGLRAVEDELRQRGLLSALTSENGSARQNGAA